MADSNIEARIRATWTGKKSSKSFRKCPECHKNKDLRVYFHPDEETCIICGATLEDPGSPF